MISRRFCIESAMISRRFCIESAMISRRLCIESAMIRHIGILMLIEVFVSSHKPRSYPLSLIDHKLYQR